MDEPRFQHAIALHAQGDLQAAGDICLEVLKQNPRHAEALHLTGLIAYQIQNFPLAITFIERAIALDQHNAVFHNNYGSALAGLKNHTAALACYERAIALKPDYAEAHFNRGRIFQELNQLSKALDNYDRAVQLKPDYVNAWNNRAIVQKALGRYEDAFYSYDQVISARPDYADTWYNRGNALIDLKRYDEALQCYQRAADLGLDYSFLWGCIAQARAYLCDWSERSADQHKLRSIVAASEPIPPFILFALFDEPELHLAAARTYGEYLTAVIGPQPPTPPHTSKIHLAYLSADFHNHATAFLMAELFEQHDRSRFELTAIYFGPETHDAMRQRITAAFDHFIDVNALSDAEVAHQCRAMGVDIAIDLKGYTTNSRPGILAARCAPVQLSYLGYPGTMGVKFIDYIVADHTLISADDLNHYTEKVIWLPNSYQVNDRQRAISERVFTRAECGLPEQGFVFCCFNNTYKITPTTFDGWMRILSRVPGSVLWLMETHPTTAVNLKAAALSRGVSADRLIFAKPLPLPEHLARHHAADLFIDTLPCNAHTTASDALWAGLPVLTLAGHSFAARVAASLLNAVDLPELITTSQVEYEHMAVTLALDPVRLAEIRQHLHENRLRFPLFDSQQFTHNLEHAFLRVMERCWAGLEPAHQ